MANSFPKTLILLLASTLLIAGCLARGGTMDESTIIEDYEQALERFTGSGDRVDAGIERFIESYGDLTHPELAHRMREVYAEELFFNDTLHTFDNRDALVDYLARTGAGLDESRVEVKQVIRDGADAFVRWNMEFRTRTTGREIHSKSIGMTHLRFDDSGRIILHQDFWDSGHALYAHLPFVGFAVRQARKRL